MALLYHLICLVNSLLVFWNNIKQAIVRGNRWKLAILDLLTSQANSAFLGRFFCIGQQQLWRGTWNFKIFFSRPLFTIIFKPKMVISRLKILVTYSSRSRWCVTIFKSDIKSNTMTCFYSYLTEPKLNNLDLDDKVWTLIRLLGIIWIRIHLKDSIKTRSEITFSLKSVIIIEIRNREEAR